MAKRTTTDDLRDDPQLLGEIARKQRQRNRAEHRAKAIVGAPTEESQAHLRSISAQEFAFNPESLRAGEHTSSSEVLRGLAESGLIDRPGRPSFAEGSGRTRPGTSRPSCSGSVDRR